MAKLKRARDKKGRPPLDKIDTQTELVCEVKVEITAGGTAAAAAPLKCACYFRHVFHP